MCMKETNEGCILLKRMEKVEVRTAKMETRQNLILVLVIMIGVFLGYITIKLMNTQIYLLTGREGLDSITTVSHGDITTIKNTVKEVK